MKHIKGTPHSREVIDKIVELSRSGIRSKDIYKNSKTMFGYTIKQSTISVILSRYDINAKQNTFKDVSWRTKAQKESEQKSMGIRVVKKKKLRKVKNDEDLVDMDENIVDTTTDDYELEGSKDFEPESYNSEDFEPEGYDPEDFESEEEDQITDEENE